MAVGVSEVTVEGFLRSGRDEKMAAVAAAPVAAEMPAMMARVVLDIVSVCRLGVMESNGFPQLIESQPRPRAHDTRSHQALYHSVQGA